MFTSSKESKTLGFCSMSKNDGRCGTFEEEMEGCMSRGRGKTRNMFIRDVRKERDCILEHQIFSFGKMMLRDQHSVSYDDLASLFRGSQNTLDRWSGEMARRIGTRPSAQHATFHSETNLAEVLRF